MRYFVFLVTIFLSGLFGFLVWRQDWIYLWGLVAFGPLALLGIYDLLQRRHSVLRNYPVIGHLRWLFEEIRPELRQYFFASDTEEEPFNREQRSLVYQRAKDVEDKTPFGTQLDVYEAEYSWLSHSIVPVEPGQASCQVNIGGPDCKQPYSSSVLNISAMSFGSLSGRAIQALNRGAKMGGFAHDTGEGSISRYHRAEGGDLIWEIGTGYFGCRRPDGGFSQERYKEQAVLDQVKMVEVKLSQGAKPGHGGILPASKLTEEIAEAREVPMGEDVVSPSSHSAFRTPLEMMEFLALLREGANGKPVGFKLCIGHRWEFLALLKAMIETGIKPDFIVIDGAEGGTGAAPIEFSNHIGTPLIEGLTFARNALVGAGLKEEVSLGAAGKIISAFDMVRVLSLGADYCLAARAFMFALGCVQSRKCHTNDCPTGVATQDPIRQNALIVENKAKRVCNFHRNTVEALREVLSAAGLSSPSELRRHYFYHRDGDGVAYPADARGVWLESGSLLEKNIHPAFADDWAMADTASFRPRSIW